MVCILEARKGRSRFLRKSGARRRLTARLMLQGLTAAESSDRDRLQAERIVGRKARAITPEAELERVAYNPATPQENEYLG